METSHKKSHWKYYRTKDHLSSLNVFVLMPESLMLVDKTGIVHEIKLGYLCTQQGGAGLSGANGITYSQFSRSVHCKNRTSSSDVCKQRSYSFRKFINTMRCHIFVKQTANSRSNDARDWPTDRDLRPDCLIILLFTTGRSLWKQESQSKEKK